MSDPIKYVSQDNLNQFAQDMNQKQKTIFGAKSVSDQLVSDVDQVIADIAVLDGRVDNITSLPAGSVSTSADAELVDIRVGADGTVYSTAGDAVREQVKDVHDIVLKEMYQNVLYPTAGYAIALNVGVGNPVDMTPYANSSHRYNVVAVKKNDRFIITGKSNTPAGRVWGFVDSTYTLLSVADPLATIDNLLLVAPADGYLITNMVSSYTMSLVKINYVSEYPPFYKKKISMYGDSVIYNDWWRIVNNYFEATSTNQGVAGTTVSGSSTTCMCNQTRINQIPSDANFIFIGAGTNDWAQNIPLGDKNVSIQDGEVFDDVTTFYQACHVMFRKIATTRPSAKIIVLGTPFGKIANKAGFADTYGLYNGLGLTSLDYGNALCDVAEMWGHHALRYGNYMGINDSNVDTLLDPSNTDSHLHPTIDASKNMFRNALLNGLLAIKYV